ncbi:antibiotic biosynthesis monooxygenase [Cohnella cholangitidis]|uniref:Antibiotic biosynthesis monooxygenase n=1 Tax=Cohnella cholangitidis TaxID=2598458 RepID=A0A7G5BSK9_9BACL|nr:antibiotic biosynthesis monooxygenase [Cohnella cholangitidis]QMV39943.1 antibiotic biosynthesis monooxygenase [Cohnella cholangitidis]
MLIQTRTIVVEPGNADKVVERFSQEGILDNREGLIDISVMVNKRSKENEEVVVFIRWESEEAWKNWEKSPEHIQGHRDNKGQQPPDYVISTTVNMYEVKKVRKGKFSSETV